MSNLNVIQKLLNNKLTYKQAVEIAEEQAIKVLMAGNKYD